MTKTVFRVLGVVASLAVGGAAVAADSPAIEWKVSDGGNGHWYRFVYSPTISWHDANTNAKNVGGFLADFESKSESLWIFTFVSNQTNGWTNGGPFLGAFQTPGSTEPLGGWHWTSGMSWSDSFWAGGEPNNHRCDGSVENYGVLVQSFINDVPPINGTGCSQNSNGFLIEWSVDCNGDGSVDYGQIQSGELADTNHNNIPDVCEIHVTYVQPISGPASGGTAVNINGMNFPTTVSVLFGGVAATDVVVVSSTLITAVTPVGVPGMTVVTVNGVGGEAFYYRSNCQSDLDGSGGVDSSDLGILLLDFGSCGESSAVAPQQEPLIFQTTQTATPVLNKK